MDTQDIPDTGKVASMKHAADILGLNPTFSREGYALFIYKRPEKRFICKYCKGHRKGQNLAFIYFGDLICNNPDCLKQLQKEYKMPEDLIK